MYNLDIVNLIGILFQNKQQTPPRTESNLSLLPILHFFVFINEHARQVRLSYQTR